MNQIESKSILAKCLATENIAIVHDPRIPTAAFDVKNRKLHLPLWKEMSPELYDLFIGHEVGHAHETPAEGWHDAVCDDRSKKNFLNVVEDVRIERKVKERYPGLVSRFYKGYKELVDKDFFGLGDIDINKLPLIDRVNLHYKVGHMMGVVFTDEEQDLVDRIGLAETWEDVETLANELFEANKKDAASKEDELQSMIDEMMPKRFLEAPEGMEAPGDSKESDKDFDINDQESDSFGSPIDPDEGREDEIEREAREAAEEQERKEKEEEEYQRWLAQTPEERQAELDAKQAARDQEIADQELKEKLDKLQDSIDSKGEGSLTDQSFRDNEKTLIDQDAIELVYLSPQKVDYRNFIVPMDELYDWDKCIELQRIVKNKEGYWDHIAVPQSEVQEIGRKSYDKYMRQQTPIINSMAQQFELKKAATAYKKASIAKTGKLNEDKLWAYKLTDDLFQRSMVIPDGKNHGIMMYVDMSGSMYSNMSGTLDQMMNVAMFCRKVNIPFEVYGFSTCGRYSKKGEPNAIRDYNREAAPEGEMVIDDTSFRMVHMLSSTCSKNQFNNAIQYLLLMKMGFDQRQYYTEYNENDCYGYIKNRHFSLGSTPLNTGIMIGKEISKDFQRKYNIEILSTIFLTDGGATDNINYISKTDYNGNPIADNPDYKGTYRLDNIYDERIAIKDGSSTICIPVNSERYARSETPTPTLLEWYKASTGSRLINFHIIGGKKNKFWNESRKNFWMTGEADREYYPTAEWTGTEWKKCLKDKFMMIEDKYGFDQRFLIKGKDNLKIKDQELEVKSSKRGDLLRGFRTFNKGKTSQRIFLNKIIELVA